jgi:predicted nucleic acid-binding protein
VGWQGVNAETERAILDTSVVIGPEMEPATGIVAISAVTLAELHFGVLVAKSTGIRAERLRRLSAIQRKFDALPVDDAVAASYGLLASAVVEAGRQPRRRTADLLIAATAHAHGAALYTRNADDFIGLDEHIDVIAV